jgi:hypothetical protein
MRSRKGRRLENNWSGAVEGEISARSASSIPMDRQYYQYANRLAVLHFLNAIANVPARLLHIYFTGDVFPCARHGIVITRSTPS